MVKRTRETRFKETTDSHGSRGVRKRCKHVGCDKSANGAYYCIRHGGGDRCKHDGCKKSAQQATDFCKRHGGGKRCQHVGCDKSAEGAAGFCIRHGGGKRCQHAGCDKSAAGATDFCKRHGGGKRCKHVGCDKSAEGAAGFCIRHGGGKRCQHVGCGKSARGATGFCKRHGGGKRCQQDGCNKSAEGATDLCAAHGGGKRCPNCITWVDSRCGTSKYDWYCATCFKRVFPDDPRSKVIYEHTKEVGVRNFINKHFEGFVHDTPMWIAGCDCVHRRRIDHRRLVEGTMLAVETDEFAHRSYDKRDEEIRYDDLVAYHTGKWIFLRFNPDGGQGVDFEDMLSVLRDQIETHIERIQEGQNTDLVEIYKLYY